MRFGFGKRGRPSAAGLAGIVISDDAVTAVHLHHEAGQPPQLLSRLDAVGAEPQRNLQALAEWVAAHQLHGVPATLTLNYGSYQTHQVDKPDVPADELRAALRWRLKDVLDHSPADAVIDCFDSPPTRQKRIEPAQVVAARISRLKPLVAALQATGLDLQRIDIPEFALRNLLSRALDRHDTTALLYLLPQRGVLQICRDDTFYFARTLEHGLEALVRASGGGAFSGHSDLEDRIALEAQRTMDYYDSHFGQGPVKKLLVLGRGIELQRLAEHIASALGIAAQLVTPAELVRGLDAAEPTHELMPLALGGALGCA